MGPAAASDALVVRARSRTARHPDSRQGAGIALCLVSAVGFGLMAVFAKQAFDAGAGVTALLAGRFALAALVLWAIVVLRRGPRAAPRPPCASRRVVLTCVALGAVGYSAQAGFFFSALRHIDASLTSLLLYTYPALVFCGTVALRRELLTPRKALALATAGAGTALVLLGGGMGGLEATGVALGLAAGVTYAVYILVADGVVRRVEPFVLGALVTTGAAATFLAAGAASATLALPAASLVWVAALALLSTVLPIVAFLRGLDLVGASTASIVSTLEPVVTVALAVALYGDALGPWQALGAAFVLAAVVALQLRGAPALAPRPRPLAAECA